MNKCIDSLLVGGDDVEIIIVNDGSTDGTAAIADDYAAKYPDIVRVCHKENGGHGSGVNKGLELATGIYYKVVDSDDWVDADAYKHVLDTMKRHLSENTLPDLYITNFVYDRVHDGKFHISRYADKIKPETLCDFSKMKKFRFSRMLLMHALIYKRDRLLASKVVLPEHTFYVDNIFAYTPLPFMNSVYYMDVNFYYYFIGRPDQSVSRRNIVNRYEQQIRVMKQMIDDYSYAEIKNMSKGLRRFMFHALSVIMMVTIYFTCASPEKERRVKLKEMWAYIKSRDKKLYRKLRYRSYPAIVNFMPWRFRGFVMGIGYDMFCRRICVGV